MSDEKNPRPQKWTTIERYILRSTSAAPPGWFAVFQDAASSEPPTLKDFWDRPVACWGLAVRTLQKWRGDGRDTFGRPDDVEKDDPTAVGLIPGEWGLEIVEALEGTSWLGYRGPDTTLEGWLYLRGHIKSNPPPEPQS